MCDGGLSRGCHPPHGVADIVCEQQRTRLVDGDPDRTAESIAFQIKEPSEHVDGSPAGHPSTNGTKITLYPLRGLRFQRAVLPDEGAILVRTGSCA
jgi:hypothetical protein